MDVRTFIDLHVHIGPEILPRKYTISTLVASEKNKLRGMALKSHFYPTMPLIKSVMCDDMLLIGSVTLNNAVGGLNPEAITASANISDKPLIVWFPTISAANFLAKSQYEIPPEWVGGGFQSRLSSEVNGIKIIDNKRRLVPEARSVLQTIKDTDCILATGHVSWQEAQALVEEALGMGIRKIIITHPIYQLIAMPIEVQRELSKNNGVYVEHNYAMYSIDKIPIADIAEQIKYVTPKKCIISSDVGQPGSPSPSRALKTFAELLRENGLSNDDIEQMGATNPLKLIQC